MKKYMFLKGIKIGVMVLVAGTAMIFAVMLLWNALLPGIMGVTAITFWEAAGLILLSKLLFGGRGGWGGRRRGRGRWRKRWEARMANMSEEDRARMRAKWGKHCGPGRGSFGDDPEKQVEIG